MFDCELAFIYAFKQSKGPSKSQLDSLLQEKIKIGQLRVIGSLMKTLREIGRRLVL